MQRSCKQSKGESGHAVVEVALLSPWILLLFLAIFNFGYFMYAGISVANAARAAALELGRRSSNRLDQALACTIIRSELEYLPNASLFPPTCNAAPLNVTVTGVVALDDPAELGTRVRVTYSTIQLFPLPWMAGQVNISRQTEMRMYE
jgi:Flp pilus assembly protein TadG